jgi:hypothetical protein
MNLYDAQHHLEATFGSGPGGTETMRDPLGNLQATFHPMGSPGNGFCTDALGNITQRVMQVGAQTNFYDANWRSIGSATQLLGKTFLRDPNFAPVASFDPMFGNITDAIGMLAGRIR